MNKPKLPSELHPDYPKPYIWQERGMNCIRPAPHSCFIEFHQMHPEFANEGDYKLICPFCEDENHYTDQMGYCCGEVGHCEWVYFNKDGEEE